MIRQWCCYQILLLTNICFDSDELVFWSQAHSSDIILLSLPTIWFVLQSVCTTQISICLTHFESFDQADTAAWHHFFTRNHIFFSTSFDTIIYVSRLLNCYQRLLPFLLLCFEGVAFILLTIFLTIFFIAVFAMRVVKRRGVNWIAGCHVDTLVSRRDEKDWRNTKKIWSWYVLFNVNKTWLKKKMSEKWEKSEKKMKNK